MMQEIAKQAMESAEKEFYAAMWKQFDRVESTRPITSEDFDELTTAAHLHYRECMRHYHRLLKAGSN